MKLTYLFLFITCICFAQEKDILLIGNYEPICIEGENIQRVEVLPDDLNNYQIIMLFSSASSRLNNNDLERIIDFVEHGGGIYSGSENWPLIAESNQLTQKIYKKESFGNYHSDKIEFASTYGNLQLENLSDLPAGKTTSAFPLDYRLKVEAWVSDQALILSGNIGKGRIIIDGGYSRFYCENTNELSVEMLSRFITYLNSTK